MTAMVDRLFIPAPFVGLLADMPPASAPEPARASWLDRTFTVLSAAVLSAHGVEALRLAEFINYRRHEIGGGVA